LGFWILRKLKNIFLALFPRLPNASRSIFTIASASSRSSRDSYPRAKVLVSFEAEMKYLTAVIVSSEERKVESRKIFKKREEFRQEF